eukprot:228142_1
MELFNSRYHLVGGREVKKTLVEKESLVGGSNESDHGKTAVNNFLFEPDLLLRIRQPVPAPSFPSSQSSWPAISVDSLLPVGKLEDADGQQSLEVGSESNGGNGLKRISGGVSGTREVGAILLPDHTGHGEHADASVLNLGPTCVTQVGLDV